VTREEVLQLRRALKRIRAKAAAALRATPPPRQPGEGRDNVHAYTIRAVGKLLDRLEKVFDAGPDLPHSRDIR